jgi:hypothetical protein
MSVMPFPSDAQSYDLVLSVLRGKRVPLDPGSRKMLSLVVCDRAGCDLEITPSSFTVSWSSERSHAYYLWCAPGLVSFLLDGMPMPPTPRLTRQLGPMTLAASDRAPRLDVEERHLRIEALDERLSIRVRDSAATLDDELPAPPPLPEPPVGHRCPHCNEIPERYRVLADRTIVCLACGRSSRP